MKKSQEVMIKWDFPGKMRGHKISALPDEASAVLLILLVCLFGWMEALVFLAKPYRIF